jgi:hypothetical protein
MDKKLKKLEDKIWTEIAYARSALALMEFVVTLQKKSDKHQLHRDAPVANAIYSTAVDSLIMCLGRLLQPNPKGEHTLALFRNKVLKALHESKAESEIAKDNLVRLCQHDFIKGLKKQQKIFASSIMPWRDKVLAHSNDGELPVFPKNLGVVVEFVEDTHRILLSALEDAGIPGPYISETFLKSTQKWINCLTKR